MGGFIDREENFEMSRRSFEKSRVLTERSPSPQDETVADVSSDSAECRKTAGKRYIFPNILRAQNAPNSHFYFHDPHHSISIKSKILKKTTKKNETCTEITVDISS